MPPRVGWLRERRVLREVKPERRALHVPQAHTPCCQGGVRDLLRSRASDRPRRVRRRRRWQQQQHDHLFVGAEAGDHARHQELRRGVHPRPALRPGAPGEGLPGDLQGQLRLLRARRQGDHEREDEPLSRVHGHHRPRPREVEERAEVGECHLRRREEVRGDARPDAAQSDAVRGHGHVHDAHLDGDEGRPEDDERPEASSSRSRTRAIRSARRGSPASSG